jgi:hypothetical protein
MHRPQLGRYAAKRFAKICHGSKCSRRPRYLGGSRRAPKELTARGHRHLNVRSAMLLNANAARNAYK